MSRIVKLSIDEIYAPRTISVRNNNSNKTLYIALGIMVFSTIGFGIVIGAYYHQKQQQKLDAKRKEEEQLSDD